MATQPENQKSKFVLQVFDGKKYRPCYMAPHATSSIYGDTKIVDTVKTPSKEGANDGDGTAASTSIVPSPKAVSDAIATALKNEELPAARAKHLTVGKTLYFDGGGTFKATLENALSVDKQTVTFSGVLPLSAIPKAAQERLVICKDKGAAVTQAQSGDIQQGDVVQIPEDGNDGHNVMYYMYNAYYTNASFDGLFKIFSAGHSTDADKLNTNAGSSAKPVYFSNGVPVACSDNVGSNVKPTYMNSGTITASDATVGSGIKPIYINDGTITACTPYSEASVKYATSAGTVPWTGVSGRSVEIPITLISPSLSYKDDKLSLTLSYHIENGVAGPNTSVDIPMPTDYMTSLSSVSAAKDNNVLKITVTGTKKDGSSTSQFATINADMINNVAGSTIRSGITNSISYDNNGTLTSTVSGHSATTIIPIKVTN